MLEKLERTIKLAQKHISSNFIPITKLKMSNKNCLFNNLHYYWQPLFELFFMENINSKTEIKRSMNKTLISFIILDVKLWF
jgi:hypothetical protein